MSFFCLTYKKSSYLYSCMSNKINVHADEFINSI